jgi:hypothetical protein
MNQLAPVMAHHRYRIALLYVQIRARVIDGSAQDQRNVRLDAVSIDSKVLVDGPEMEFERPIALGVAVVVHMNRIDGFRIEIEIIRTSVWILQRNVVGDQSDICAASRLVAAKHVEISTIHARLSGN